MGVMRHIEILQVNSLVPIVHPANVVYRLTYLPTGDFYIGCTSKADFRITDHINSMKLLMEQGVIDPGLAGLPFHVYMLPILMEHHSKTRFSISKFLLRSFAIDFHAIVNDINDAKFFEKFYIDKHLHNPLCRNIRRG